MFSTPVSKSSEFKNPPAIPKKIKIIYNDDISNIEIMMSRITITSISRKLKF